MKIAGCMPIGGLSKPDFGSLVQLRELCDVSIVLRDNQTPHEFGVDDVTTIDHHGEWNDWTNRLTLLARATAHDCDWIVHLDDDELLHAVTKDTIRAQIEQAVQTGREMITYAVREIWTREPLQYRADGMWGNKRKVVIQRNPFMRDVVCFGRRAKLHAQCLQTGSIMHTESQLLHMGMCSPGLRLARVEKYKTLDPQAVFNKCGYDYMLDETGIQLQPV